MLCFPSPLFGKSGEGSPGIDGALAYRTSVSAQLADGDPVPMQVEAYDTGNYFTLASPAVMTVPADGIYRVMAGTSSWAASGTVGVLTRIRRGGSAYYGNGTHRSNAERESNNMPGAPRSHAAGSTPGIVAGSSAFYGVDFGDEKPERTWLAIERLPDDLKYCIARKNASQALSANTVATLTWQVDVVDTNNFHDEASNTSRMTVPAGVTLVRLVGNLFFASFSGRAVGRIYKGGSFAHGLPQRCRAGASSSRNFGLISAPIEVSAGEYFELQALAAAASSIAEDTGNYFAIEEVSSSLKRALVHNSAGHSLTTSFSSMQWDSQVYDTHGMRDGSNPNRLVVPAGCSFARAIFSLRTPTADMTAYVRKNGSLQNYAGVAYDEGHSNGSACYVNAASAWLPVVPGDWFEVRVLGSSAETMSTESWFSLECI